MKTSARTLVALTAALLCLVGTAAFAGDSSMSSPLPSLNVWSAGKSSLSLYGGMGSTATVFTPSVAWGETAATAKYDDDDLSFGLRYAFPISESVTLEAGASYFKRNTELQTSPYTYQYEDVDYNFHEVVMTHEKQTDKNWKVDLTGLYTLPSGADSPIRGGFFFGIDGGKSDFTEDFVGTDNGSPLPFVADSGEKFYGASIGLTADIHVVRDVLRVTPMAGYRYHWTSPDEGDSQREGGAMYGLELGYRPGGAEGKFEIVVSPYFKEERRVVLGGLIEKSYEHRNAWTVLLRYTF
jgi:hypothetical protein